MGLNLSTAYAGVEVFARPTGVDLDNDGDFDLPVGTKDGQVHYYENVGDRTSPVYVLRIGAENPFYLVDASNMAIGAYPMGRTYPELEHAL